MKNKALWIVMLAFLSFTSCTKETVNNVDQAFSAVYTVDASSWQTINGGVSYYVNLTVPELTNNIVQNGAVEVYLSFDSGVSYETIPEVYKGIAYGSLQQYQTVTIDLYDVNGSTISAPNGTIIAKVVLVDATPLP